MIVFNKAFQNSAFLDNLTEFAKQERVNNPKLIRFLDNLLTYQDGAFFLNFNGRQHVPATDLTGFECSLNSFYISDFFADINCDNIIQYLGQCCSEIAFRKKSMGIESHIVFIASSQFDDYLEFRLNFHINRENEHYLDENIDRYNEPILISVL